MIYSNILCIAELEAHLSYKLDQPYSFSQLNISWLTGTTLDWSGKKFISFVLKLQRDSTTEQINTSISSPSCCFLYSMCFFPHLLYFPNFNLHHYRDKWITLAPGFINVKLNDSINIISILTSVMVRLRPDRRSWIRYSLDAWFSSEG